MARSRAGEVLESWKMVAHSAVRPATAPRPRSTRNAIPVGMLAAAAVVLVLLVALSSRGISPGPQASVPIAGGNPTPQATIAPSPLSSPSASATASPALSPTIPVQTPSPAEAAAAKDAVDRYTAALVRGNYTSAFAMLAPESRAHWGSLANFTYDRSLYFKSVGGSYAVQVWPTDVAPITAWLPATYGASIDLRHAVLVKVAYPALAGNNAGFDLYIVSPGANGPEIFDVR